MDLKKIVRKFRGYERGKLLDETKEHIQKSVETNVELKKATDAYLNEDFDELDGIRKKGKKLEEEADDMRRSILTKVAKGHVVPFENQEYMALIDSMDELADLAKDGIEVLWIQKEGFPEEIKENVRCLQEEVFKIVEMTRDAALTMRPDIQKAYEMTWDIEKQESKIDTMFISVRKEIFQLDMGVPQFFQLYEFVNLLEKISDSAEEVSNQIRLLSGRYLNRIIKF